MANEVKLNVILPKNRDHTGWLRVEVDGFPRAEFRVLGRGSTTKNNPTQHGPFLEHGDTPTGEYDSPGVASTAGQNEASYGPNGKVLLEPRTGDALLAKWLGRDLFRIHGGAPGAFDNYRATWGCLRLSNQDMYQLRSLLSSASDDARNLQCKPITVRLTVREF